MSSISKAALTSLLLTLATISSLPLSAQEDEGARLTSKLSDKFEIHGYLSLAYAQSDGHQVLGIPEDGTFEYNNAALQLRYKPTDNDELVVQLSRDHLGDSPSNDLHKDLELDWLFYNRQFTDATSISLGRIPLPIGIYNKTRDVGTLLPFFRPSTSFYGDGAWTSETVDGLLFSHKFTRSSPWSLGVELYYGEWERIETDPSTETFAIADVSDGVGLQLWLDTPLSGVRFGVGVNQYDVSGGVFFPPGVEQEMEGLYLSFDASFDRAVFRTEYQETTFTGGHFRAFYAELLVRITERLRLTAMYDQGELRTTVPFFGTFESNVIDEYALGLNFAIRHNLVLKLEHHWFEGFLIEDQPVDVFFGEPLDVNYGILSLSMHF